MVVTIKVDTSQESDQSPAKTHAHLCDDLDVVVDINSIIWVTCSPHFRTPLSIYLGPIIEDKAPMHKNNHVYVDILVPQSQNDANTI